MPVLVVGEKQRWGNSNKGKIFFCTSLEIQPASRKQASGRAAGIISNPLPNKKFIVGWFLFWVASWVAGRQAGGPFNLASSSADQK